MTVTPASRDLLAIHGGPPVRKTLLPYGHQSIDEADIQAVVETLRSDWLTTGPKVAEFEEAFAARTGAKHAVSFSSGTAALHAAAFAAGLKAGRRSHHFALDLRCDRKLRALSGSDAGLCRRLAGHPEPRSRTGSSARYFANPGHSARGLCRPSCRSGCRFSNSRSAMGWS